MLGAMTGVIGLAVVAVAATGCQGLYSGKAESMKKPPQTAVPLDVDEPPPPPPEITACNTNVHKSPAGVVRKRDVAQAAATRGDGILGQARREPDPKRRTADYLSGLGSYKDALLADPYHLDATLQMAVTYDDLHYKGCALVLLGRIGDMQANSLYAVDANRVADAVRATPQWFKTYRNEALKAVNR
jgi:hypothetical protein